MKRIFFLAPNLDSTHSIVDECVELGVESKDIHIVGKDTEAIEMEHLPEATLLQNTDFVPAVERGLVAGGTVGLVSGLVAVSFPPAGLVLGGGAVLGMGLFGAGFGAWVSGMIGVSHPNSHLKRFEEALEQGELLILIDVPKDMVDEISAAVIKHHPEAHIEGVEPTIPPVFGKTG